MDCIIFKIKTNMEVKDKYGRTAEQIERDEILTQEIKDWLKERGMDTWESLERV